jgi:hypothetical protein
MNMLTKMGSAVLLAGCALGMGGAALAEGDVLYLRSAMKDAVNPAIFGIWDITNNAMSDSGGIDPALMDEAKWATVEARALDLAKVSRAMAAAATLRAAAPDDMAVDEGAVPMDVIQRHVDANPDAFRAFALVQAEHADKLANAAAARDATTAGALVADLDGVCESCHARFWYPEQ